MSPAALEAEIERVARVLRVPVEAVWASRAVFFAAVRRVVWRSRLS